MASSESEAHKDLLQSMSGAFFHSLSLSFHHTPVSPFVSELLCRDQKWEAQRLLCSNDLQPKRRCPNPPSRPCRQTFATKNGHFSSPWPGPKEDENSTMDDAFVMENVTWTFHDDFEIIQAFHDQMHASRHLVPALGPSRRSVRFKSHLSQLGLIHPTSYWNDGRL